MRYIVGLGNPGEEYELTRHNAGRMAVLELARQIRHQGLPLISRGVLDGLVFDKKINALVGRGEIGKEKIQIILPETFMNKSGDALKKTITSTKIAKNLIVVHDDIDLPLGKIKISFGKNSGGHKGVESVIKAVKTVNFTRVRIGISASNAKGVMKKPSGEKFLDFIIGKFKPTEMAEMKKVAKKATEILTMIAAEGFEKAMGKFN